MTKTKTPVHLFSPHPGHTLTEKAEAYLEQAPIRIEKSISKWVAMGLKKEADSMLRRDLVALIPKIHSIVIAFRSKRLAKLHKLKTPAVILAHEEKMMARDLRGQHPLEATLSRSVKRRF